MNSVEKLQELLASKPRMPHYSTDRVVVDHDRLLVCPKCHGENLHHRAIHIFSRDCEDGPGTVTTVHPDGSLNSYRVNASDFTHGHRRDHLVIDFTCEICDGMQEEIMLEIKQHKGSTIFTWIK